VPSQAFLLKTSRLNFTGVIQVDTGEYFRTSSHTFDIPDGYEVLSVANALAQAGDWFGVVTLSWNFDSGDPPKGYLWVQWLFPPGITPDGEPFQPPEGEVVSGYVELWLIQKDSFLVRD
jgi:hypothetical protein